MLPLFPWDITHHAAGAFVLVRPVFWSGDLALSAVCQAVIVRHNVSLPREEHRATAAIAIAARERHCRRRAAELGEEAGAGSVDVALRVP